MKKTGLAMLAAVLILALSGVAAADRGKGGSDKWPQGKSRHGYDDRDHRGGRDDHRWREEYHGYHGYREHPYDRGRHYGHYKHGGHRFEYRGHWRSWDEWDHYASRHPHMYRHGHYYREGAHLMFRFCDPVGGPCFFFSIGR